MSTIQHNTEEDIGEEPQAPLQRLASESYSGESEMSSWQQTSNFSKTQKFNPVAAFNFQTQVESGDCNGK